jgi:hypothetical protein
VEVKKGQEQLDAHLRQTKYQKQIFNVIYLLIFTLPPSTFAGFDLTTHLLPKLERYLYVDHAASARSSF